MGTEAERVCRICQDRSDGAHFGVDSCRACAAFFRRSIVMKKKYICRQGTHNCNINKSVRCMCRSCRFRKCLKAGMSREAVQNPRDQIGRRDMVKLERPESRSEASFTEYYNTVMNSATASADYANDIIVCSENQAEGLEASLPILTNMQRGYALLQERRANYWSDPNELLALADLSPFSDCYMPQRKPSGRRIDVNHANKLLFLEYEGVCNYVKTFLPNMEQLKPEQKQLLYRSFYPQFLFLESAYMTSHLMPNQTDKWFVCDGNYIDLTDLGTFYGEGDGMTPAEAHRMFTPSFNLFVKNLLKPLQTLLPTELEMCALFVLCYFSAGIEGEEEHTENIGRNIRDQVFRELYYYYSTVRGMRDSAIRLAHIINFLPSIQRVANRHFEDVLLTKMFNTKFDDTIYKLFKTN